VIDGKKITVAVPAHNEERLIGRTLDSLPDYVDHVVVIDDASTDGTARVLAERRESRLEIVSHARNGGVGAAIVSGYRRFLAGNGDVCVVMAGDAQMDPRDLPALLAPVVEGRADYAKGNRFEGKDIMRVMPKDRLVGNIIFTLMTKWASGYWHVVDSQCGYTAITRAALERIDLDRVYARYGVPNDILVKLNAARARVGDVPVRAIYGEEVSGINPWITIPRICLLLVRGFWWRMWQRYVLRDFHLLVLLYVFGSILTALGVAMGVWIAVLRLIQHVRVTEATIMLCALCLIIGVQSVLFAMVFDVLHNAELKAHEPRR
jgi:glycosyltransferase involved in cell wall biosynthesis